MKIASIIGTIWIMGTLLVLWINYRLHERCINHDSTPRITGEMKCETTTQELIPEDKDCLTNLIYNPSADVLYSQDNRRNSEHI